MIEHPNADELPLRGLVARAQTTGHLEGLLAAEATHLIEDLEDRTDLDPAAVGTHLLLAQARLLRFQVLPEGREATDELFRALHWYGLVGATTPDLVPPAIQEVLDGDGATELDISDPSSLSDEDLELAIDAMRADQGGAQDLPGEVNLAALLLERSSRVSSPSMADLQEVIDRTNLVLTSSPDGFTEYAALVNQCRALQELFRLTGDALFLDDAVEKLLQIAQSTGDADDLGNACGALLSVYEHRHDDQALTLALDLARRCVEAASADDPELAGWLSNLAIALRYTIGENQRWDLLEEAVSSAQESVNLTGEVGAVAARRLNNLGILLGTRFDRDRESADADLSVAALEQAVAAGAGAMDQASRQANLATALRTRGAAFGSRDDLLAALQIAIDAALDLPEEHADRADLLGIAAGCAMVWFDWTGDLQAVDIGVELGREAIRGLPATDPAWARRGDLAMYLLTRYEVQPNLADLDDAVALGRQALAAARGEELPVIAMDLALSLRMRFAHAREPADLEEALSVLCLIDRPLSLPDEDAAAASSISLCLWEARLLRPAILWARKAAAVDAMCGTAAHAAHLANLARMLQERGSAEDQQESAELWQAVASSDVAPVALRLQAAMSAAEGFGRYSPDSALRWYRLAVRLIPESAWHGLEQTSRVRRLESANGVVRDATAMALTCDAPLKALALLDDGLAHLWARDVDFGGLSGSLTERDPELANGFESIRMTRRALGEPRWRADLRASRSG